MKNFLKKNGYYFILIACVVAVCVGGIIVLEKRAENNAAKLPEQLGNVNIPTTAPTKKPVVTLKPSSADYDDETPTPTVIPTLPATSAPTAKPTETPSANVTTKPSYSEDEDGSVDVNRPVGDGNSAGSDFILPVGKLEIITEFANDKLIYNKTLKEWRIHPAVDLKAEAGSNVLCCMDGKVSDVLSDPLYGTTVVIDHGNNLSTVYCGIGIVNGLSAGSQVKKGDIIGTVSENGIFCERELGSHIHFEIVQNGEKVDPNMFFEKATSSDALTDNENSEAVG